MLTIMALYRTEAKDFVQNTVMPFSQTVSRAFSEPSNESSLWIMRIIFRADRGYSNCADFGKHSFADFRDRYRAECHSGFCANCDDSIWLDCFKCMID